MYFHAPSGTGSYDGDILWTSGSALGTIQGIENSGFTFGGLSEREGLVSHENDSIAGMTYQKDKKNPLPLIQAEKAMELLDRFDAEDFDPDTYDGAMTALTEARDLKGKEQLDAANRSVTCDVTVNLHGRQVTTGELVGRWINELAHVAIDAFELVL